MKINYIAWGSLLWNNTILELDIPWKKTNIKLPLQFSRISDNGKGRLTLVLDNKNGILNNVFTSQTKIQNLNKAINTLKKREKTITNMIGYINNKNKTYRTNLLNSSQIQKLFDLADKEKIDAIVWTDIPPNFEKVLGVPFSLQAALDYIESKRTDIKLFNEIIGYIVLSKSYGKINTPLSNYVIKHL